MVAPSVAQSSTNARYMGEISCGSWPKYKEVGDGTKAVPLNFVLGFLFGRAAQAGTDPLGIFDIPSVAAWMDNYCQANPLATIIEGAFLLEKEMTTRQAR